MQQTHPVFAIASQLRRNWTFLNGWIAPARRSQASETEVAAEQQRSTERRRLDSGLVEFGYIDENSRVLRGSGRLLDRSDSGMRFWTTARLKQGAAFLVWEPGRAECSATVVWTKPKRRGSLVGAQFARVERHR